MDTEQLKLILEAFSQASDGAGTLLIWYMALGCVPSVLGFGFGIFTVAAIGRSAAVLIRIHFAAFRIADKIGTPVPGMWMPSNEKKVMQRINYLLECERAGGCSKP